MLPAELQTLWQSYLESERRALKPARREALERFIAAVKATDASLWEPWAVELARTHVEGTTKDIIRLPLFRFVLFPALWNGLKRKQQGCARWLAAFDEMVSRTPEARAMGPDVNLLWILRKAIEHDPADHESKRNLVKLMVYHFEFALHEVPAGVIYVLDGATVEQCGEWQRDVLEFERLVNDIGEHERYAALIADCRLHFDAYARYLADRKGYVDYRDYLLKKTAWRGH